MLFPSFTESGSEWFVPGVNYHLIGAQGTDIGPNPILNRSSSFNNSVLRRHGSSGFRGNLFIDFQRLASWGFKAVRIWVMEDGEGIEWRTSGNSHIAQRLNTEFIDNVTLITEAAAACGLRIYWTLLNATNFFVRAPVIPQNADESHVESYYNARGELRDRIWQEHLRHIDRTELDQYCSDRFRLPMNMAFNNILTDNSARRSFFSNVIRPFIQRMDAHRDGIFGIDIMNEPEFLWPFTEPNISEVFRRNRQHPPPISSRRGLQFGFLTRPPQYQSEPIVVHFLNEIGRFIKNTCRSDILVSTGFQYANTIERHRRSLNQVFDFYDYHHYNVLSARDTNPAIINFNSLSISKPCIIGECGLGGQTLQGMGWRFIDAFRGRRISLQNLFRYQSECIGNYFRNSQRMNYAGCFVWEYGMHLTEYLRNIQRPHSTADWQDRFPLIWHGRGSSGGTCIRIVGEPSGTEYCGRPVVDTIHRFCDSLPT